MKSRKLRTGILLTMLVFGTMLISCPNETESDKPTRWVTINGLDEIGLNSFKYSVLIVNSENKGENIGLQYEKSENTFPAELKVPLITSVDGYKNGFVYTFWHGSGEYYVILIIIKGKDDDIYQKWKSNELIHFSDDSPNPVLSLKNAHVE